MPSRRRLTYLRSDRATQRRRQERACRSDPQAVRTCAPHTWRLHPDRNYTSARVHLLFHKDIDALPFCHLRLSVIKPTPYGFRGQPKTLGDHIRKCRLELGLPQRDVARNFAVTVATLRNWERNRTRPIARYLPRVIRFLGYDPRSAPKTLAEKLLYYKESLGLTQRTLAGKLGIDESTLTGWCAGRHAPSRRSQLKATRALAKLPRTPK